MFSNQIFVGEQMAFADRKDVTTRIRHQSRNDVTAHDVRRFSTRHNPDSDNLTANKKLKTVQPFVPKSPSQVMAESEKKLVVTPSPCKIRNPHAKKKAMQTIENMTSSLRRKKIKRHTWELRKFLSMYFLYYLDNFMCVTHVKKIPK